MVHDFFLREATAIRLLRFDRRAVLGKQLKYSLN